MHKQAAEIPFVQLNGYTASFDGISESEYSADCHGHLHDLMRGLAVVPPWSTRGEALADVLRSFSLTRRATVELAMRSEFLPIIHPSSARSCDSIQTVTYRDKGAR